MTLEQVEGVLPNGLHDAEIQELAMDYRHARLLLRIAILVGLPSQPDPDREAYRSGEILFHRVQFYSADYPKANSPFRHPGNISFSYERTPSGGIPAELEQALPPGTLCYSLFIRDWLSYIHIAAADVSFSWREN